MAAAPCHECGTPTELACVRCERATCPEHDIDPVHLGLCFCCRDELAAAVAASDRLYLSSWPWPLRAPLPSMGDPDRPFGPSDIPEES